MSLADKYNIPKATIQRMVQDGVLSCTWPMHEEVYEMFKKSMSAGGKTKTEIYIEIAEKKGLAERTVRGIIYDFSK